MQATSEDSLEDSGVWSLPHTGAGKLPREAEWGKLGLGRVPGPQKTLLSSSTSSSAQLANNMTPTWCLRAFAFPFSLHLETPSTRPTHGYCSVFKYEKTKKEMFPYSLLLWALLFPRALIGTELETSFLSSWVHHFLHPGERRKKEIKNRDWPKAEGEGLKTKKKMLSEKMGRRKDK